MIGYNWEGHAVLQNDEYWLVCNKMRPSDTYLVDREQHKRVEDPEVILDFIDQMPDEEVEVIELPPDILDIILQSAPEKSHIALGGPGSFFKGLTNVIKDLPNSLKESMDKKSSEKEEKNVMLKKIQENSEKLKELGDILDKNKDFFDRFERATDRNELHEIDLQVLNDLFKIDPKWADKLDFASRHNLIVTVKKLKELGVIQDYVKMDDKSIEERVENKISKLPNLPKGSYKASLLDGREKAGDRRVQISASDEILMHIGKDWKLDVSHFMKKPSPAVKTKDLKPSACSIDAPPNYVTLIELADETWQNEPNKQKILDEVTRTVKEGLGDGKLDKACMVLDDARKKAGERSLVLWLKDPREVTDFLRDEKPLSKNWKPKLKPNLSPDNNPVRKPKVNPPEPETPINIRKEDVTP